MTPELARATATDDPGFDFTDGDAATPNPVVVTPATGSSSGPLAIPPPGQCAGLENGTLIGDRYRVIRRIAAGGMGLVYEGRHVLLDQRVAIKVIRPELVGAGNSEAVLRLINEARVAASLRGEHIARVMDVGRLDSGLPYLVMEHLEGIDLAELLLSRRVLDIEESIGYCLEACDGLAEAHARQLIHRDIKPENLFLTDLATGRRCVKILDFGVSKRIGPRVGALTNPGQSVGSPLYMSPEQMRDPSSVDARTDIWSLGVTLYELLTGRVPFDGDTVPQICAKVLSHTPVAPRRLRPEIPERLEAVLLRCLRKDPNDRFPSVEELARSLERALPGCAVATSAPPHRSTDAHEVDDPIATARTEHALMTEHIRNASRKHGAGRTLLWAAALAAAAAVVQTSGTLDLSAPLEGTLWPARLRDDAPRFVHQPTVRRMPSLSPRLSLARAVHEHELPTNPDLAVLAP